MILCAAAFALAGCSAISDKYPSLAIRDAELASAAPRPAEPVEPIALPSPLSADTLAQMEGFLSQLRSAHTRFMRAVPAARNTVSRGRGSGVGTDSWAAAQVALADLESKRSQAAIPLADLDALYIDASVALADRTRIAEARSTAIGLISQEDAILAGLRR